MAARTEIEVVARARVEGLSSVDALNSKIGSLRKSISGVSFVMRLFGISLAGVFGGAVIRGFINGQVELSRSLGRTRFFLSGFSGSMKEGMRFANQFAESAQRAGLASANLARTISARAVVALKDETKAARVATAALQGHKLQLFDASSAIQAMADSSDGNTQAFRTFLQALGIAAPEFASLDSLIENFIRRNEDAQGAMSDFGKAWLRLTGILRDGVGKIAADLGKRLAPAITELSDILDDPVAVWDEYINLVFPNQLKIWRETFEFFFGRALDVAKGFGLKIIERLKGTFGIALAFITGGFVGGFVKIITSNFDFVQKFIKGFGDNIGKIIQATFDVIISKLSFFASVWIGSWKLLLAVLQKVWDIAWTVIRLFFGDTADEILATAKGLWSSLKEGFGLAWNFIKSATMAVWNTISEFLLGIWENIKTFASEVFGELKNVFQIVWDEIVAVIESAIEGILTAIEKITAPIEKAINLISQLLAKAKEAASSAFTSSLTRLQGFGSTLRSALPFQAGGIVTRPTLGIIGEAGPEAVIPLSRLGGMGGGGLSITITGNTFMSDEDAAVKIGDMIVRRLELVHRFGLSTP